MRMTRKTPPPRRPVLPERPDQRGVGKAGRRAAGLRLPFADRAAGGEAGRADAAADVVAELPKPALHGGEVGAQRLVVLDPVAGEAPVARVDAVGRMADEERVRVALVVFLQPVEIGRDDEGRAV